MREGVLGILGEAVPSGLVPYHMSRAKCTDFFVSSLTSNDFRGRSTWLQAKSQAPAQTAKGSLLEKSRL